MATPEDDPHKPVREMLERVIGLPVSADCTFAWMDGAGSVNVEEMLKEAFDGFHGRDRAAEPKE